MKELIEAINKISTILETFFKEYFINFIISIIFTVLLYYFMPTDNTVLLKLGNFLFYGTAFLVFFLIIYLIEKSYNKINKSIYYTKQNEIYNKKNEKEAIQKIRNFVDNLSSDERKTLNYFLENDNKPLILQGFLYGNNILAHHCDKNEFEVKEALNTYNPFTFKEEYKLNPGAIATRYKLKNDLYEPLKEMINRNINISNF